MNKTRKYWFPAKRYGWGWGVPATWQGWAVIIGYILLDAAGIPVINPGINLAGYMVYTALLTAILVTICWYTGEPVRWRRGKQEN
jgi:hypothetical protein